MSDQAVSSLTNFLVIVVVARASSAEAFGAIALALTWCQIVVGWGQEGVSQTHSVRGDEGLVPARAAISTNVLIGLFGTALALPWMITIGASAATAIILVALPLLAWQDVGRFILVREGRAGSALLGDALWLLTVVIGALLGWTSSATGGAAAWVLGGALSTAFFAFSFRLWPSVALGYQWLGRHARLFLRNSIEFLALTGAVQLSLVMVARVAGLAAIGAIRGMASLFGPVNVMLLGLRLALMPRFVLWNRSATRAFPRLAAALLVVVGVVMFWSALLFVLPADLGTELLGSTWISARELLVPFSAQYVGLAIYWVLFLWIKASRADSASLVVRGVFASASLVFALGGALLGGAVGAVWGLSFAAWLAAGLCAERLWRSGAAIDASPGERGA